MKNAALVLAVLCALLAGALVARLDPFSRDAVRGAGPAKEPDAKAQIAELKAEIKRLDGIAPDQAAVMSHLGYHWANLWFALDNENWPLAAFYLSEVRNNLKWAVRVKPIRIVNKEKIDLDSIAKSLDNAQLTQMSAAIAKKEKKKCVELYDDTLTICYSCHKASDKPFLRPQRPAAPEVRGINFDPKATKPE